MKKLIVLLVLGIAVAISGCLICNGGGWQTGEMTLKFGYAYDFDDRVYRDYEPENSCWKDPQFYKGIGKVPDIKADDAAHSQKGCAEFEGLHCEETSFGTYIKPNENVMDLGEMPLSQASVPAALEGQGWEVCARVGHSYYLKTWQDRDVLFEVAEIGDGGITINYKMR